MFNKFNLWFVKESKEFSKIPISAKILFFTLIILGTLPRVFGLFNKGFEFDLVATQYTWGKNAVEMGYFGFWQNYPMNLLYDYPPLSLLYEYFLALITKPFGYNVELFIFLLKSVNWLVEIALSLGILFLSRSKVSGQENKTESKWNFLLVALVYSLPALWFVTGVWGQNDTLMAVLAFVAMFIIFKQNPNLEITKSEVNLKLEEKHKPFYKDLNFWSGVFLGVAIEIKQQPILVLPFIIFYYLIGRNWKDIFKAVFYTLPFILMAAMASLIYSEDQKIIFGEFTNWQLISWLSFLFLIIPTTLLLVNLNNSGPWFKLRRWFFGFWATTNIILLPMLFVNYVRLAKVTFATVGRIDVVGNGAANFLTVLAKTTLGSSTFVNIFGFNLTIGQLGTIIFLVLMGYLFWTYLDLNWAKIKTLNLQKILPEKFNLVDFSLLFWVLSSAYFLFSTKMHSRYLHLGIVLSFVILALNLPSWFKKPWFKLSIGFSLFYFLNQVGVYAANNKNPYWANQLSDAFQVNPWSISSVGLSICFGIMYFLVLQYFSSQNKKS